MLIFMVDKIQSTSLRNNHIEGRNSLTCSVRKIKFLLENMLKHEFPSKYHLYIITEPPILKFQRQNNFLHPIVSRMVLLVKVYAPLMNTRTSMRLLAVQAKPGSPYPHCLCPYIIFLHISRHELIERHESQGLYSNPSKGC